MPPSDEQRAAFAARRRRLTDWMSESGIFACIVEDFESQRSSMLRWLSGHPCDALLFVFASEKSVLVPWDMNLASVRSAVDQIIPYTELGRSFRNAVIKVLDDNGLAVSAAAAGSRPRVEFPESTSHIRYLELCEDLPGKEILVRHDGLDAFLSRCRAVKDASETEALRRAAGITNQIIDKIEALLSSRKGAHGMTEMDMAQLIEHEALTLGAEGTGFETLAAGPSRSWAIHPFPPCSSGPFGGDGLSILDFGVKVDGYTSDVTLTAARGRLSPAQETMIGLVRDAYAAALAAARTGASPREPALRADEVFAAAGWTMPHALGHGIGLDAHETPLLRSRGANPDPALIPGMVFTLEPGLYHPELGGVRWENDLLISETETVELTRARIIRLP